MKPWMFILIGVSIVAAAFLYGKEIGKDLKENEVLKIQNEAATQARKQERETQEKINAGLQEQVNEKNTINANLINDINELQHRQNRRLSEASTSGCAGTSGAELAREHAGFLVRYAAKAAEQDAALKNCYNYADSVSRND